MRRFAIGWALVAAWGLSAFAQAGFAMEDEKDYATLAKALPSAKITLAQGIEQAAKSGEAVISAKFEMGDDGKLSLSIYTATKGLTVEAKGNSFKEWAGDPTGEKWAPKGEEIKEEGDLKEATEQLGVMAKAKKTLADILKAAEKEKAGTIFSIEPEMVDGKPMFVVKAAGKDKSIELHYDTTTGEKVESKK